MFEASVTVLITFIYPIARGSPCHLFKSLSHVWVFVTSWTVVCQVPLTTTNSWSLLKLTSIESVKPSNRFIFCYPFLLLPSVFPSMRVFSNNLATSGGQNIGASASATVLPMNIQGWFPLGLTGLISLQPKGFSRVFSSTTIWKNQLFGALPSLWCIHVFI